MSACVAPSHAHGRRTAPTRTSSPAPPSPPSPHPSQPLVGWTGPVEHMFFQTLVIRPELAFTSDSLGQGFRNYFVTVGEFRAILDQLYASGWTPVDIHRAVSGTVEVPPGRKPLVLSEDDVNYYDYSRPRGLGWRLVLDPAGDVKVEVRDDRGTRVTDDDLIPIVDEFVASHPLFSPDGAKGVLALTGYEGLFGERVNDPAGPDDAASVARATAVANRLRATGWAFAKPQLRPHRPDEGDPCGRDPRHPALADRGHPGHRPHRHVRVPLRSRRHVDGIAFAQQAKGLAPFFTVASVIDRAARAQRGHPGPLPTSSPPLEGQAPAAVRRAPA